MAGAAEILRWERHAAGVPAPIAAILVWQGLIYGLWIPVPVLLYRLVVRRGFVRRAFGLAAGIGALAIPAHAVLAATIDRHFTVGAKNFGALLVARLPIDILVFTAIAAAVAAVVAHARSEELKRTLAQARVDQEIGARKEDEPERLLVSVGSVKVPVALSLVESFVGAGNYVVVNWQQRDGLIRGTLRDLEERLGGSAFARCHRSTIVNLAQVASASWLADGSWRLEMNSGNCILVGRTYRDKILERLGRRRGTGEGDMGDRHP